MFSLIPNEMTPIPCVYPFPSAPLPFLHSAQALRTAEFANLHSLTISGKDFRMYSAAFSDKNGKFRVVLLDVYVVLFYKVSEE